MKSKLYILLLLLLIPLVYSLEIDFFHPQDEVLSFEKTCTREIDNSPCNAVYCNLTVYYSNSSTFIDKGNMTITAGKDLNYTISDTSTTGLYQYSIYCFNGSAFALKEGYFEINTRGTMSKPIMVGIYTLLIVLIGLFFYLALSLNIFQDEHSNGLLRIYLFFLAFAHILATTFLAYLDYNDFTGISGLLITIFTIDTITVLLLVYFYFMNKAEDAVDKAMKSIDKDFNK